MSEINLTADSVLRWYRNGLGQPVVVLGYDADPHLNFPIAVAVFDHDGGVWLETASTAGHVDSVDDPLDLIAPWPDAEPLPDYVPVRWRRCRELMLGDRKDGDA